MEDVHTLKHVKMKLITVVYLLLEGILGTVAKMEFASIGERFQLTCPDKNVDSWQKLDTRVILVAYCEQRMPVTISDRISVSDNCLNLLINNFTVKDVGHYRCYVFGKGTKTYNYDFTVTVRTNVSRTNRNVSMSVEDFETTNSTPMENSNEENVKGPRTKLPESDTNSEITNKPTTTNSGDEYNERTRTNLSKVGKISKKDNRPSTKNSGEENYSRANINVKGIDDSETPKEPPKKVSEKGLLDREIVIYSVVVACIIVILGLSYSVQKFRKKTKNDTRTSNPMQSTHSKRTHSLVSYDLNIYDEIDETMLIEHPKINTMSIGDRSNEIHRVSDNTSYLNPIHAEEESENLHASAKSLNSIGYSFNESDQSRKSDEIHKDDDNTSYLHPYHTVQDQWIENPNKYDILNEPSDDSDDLSDYSTKIIRDEYLNPYQPLKEGWEQTSDGYDTPVTVHQCKSCLTTPSLYDEDLERNNKAEIYKGEIRHDTADYVHSSQSPKTYKSETSEECHKPVSEETICIKYDPVNALDLTNDASLEPSNKKKKATTENESDKHHRQKQQKTKNDVSVRDKPYENQLDDVDVHATKDYHNNSHQCNSFDITASIKSDKYSNERDYTDAKST